MEPQQVETALAFPSRLLLWASSVRTMMLAQILLVHSPCCNHASTFSVVPQQHNLCFHDYTFTTALCLLMAVLADICHRPEHQLIEANMGPATGPSAFTLFMRYILVQNEDLGHSFAL